MVNTYKIEYGYGDNTFVYYVDVETREEAFRIARMLATEFLTRHWQENPLNRDSRVNIFQVDVNSAFSYRLSNDTGE